MSKPSSRILAIPIRKPSQSQEDRDPAGSLVLFVRSPAFSLPAAMSKPSSRILAIPIRKPSQSQEDRDPAVSLLLFVRSPAFSLLAAISKPSSRISAIPIRKPSHSQEDTNFAVSLVLFDRQYFVIVYAAPRGDIVLGSGVGAQNFERLPRCERLDPLLHSNDRHRAQESTGIEAVAGAHGPSPVEALLSSPGRRSLVAAISSMIRLRMR